MNKTWLYTVLGAILIGICQTPARGEEHHGQKNYPSTKPRIAMTPEDIPVTFEATGTVTVYHIANRSKTSKAIINYTYITIKVEKTEPADVAANLPTKELRFSDLTNEARDREISVGDRVKVTVVGNNYTDPSWFRLRDLKKINR
ncbi:hypothetical protein AEM42_08160 [Betaproteobacteria bacterium UKL13-2]|nr:hypothetical protein AEM42_08160 [Betaproteobacteria bacterium UKL13-2]HCG53060.1 hypothetical protein [Betaproteobacteria bacterium]